MGRDKKEKEGKRQPEKKSSEKTKSLFKKHYGKKNPSLNGKTSIETPKSIPMVVKQTYTSCQGVGGSKCANQNITLAQRVVDLYTAGTDESTNNLINLVHQEIILEVHDQTGLLPYADNYLGHQGFVSFFNRYNQSVKTIDSYRGETFTNCEQTKIMITVDTTQINKHNDIEGKFCQKHMFLMSFNDLGDIVRIDIFHETGPLVLFYST